jgi:hypothetical protein
MTAIAISKAKMNTVLKCNQQDDGDHNNFIFLAN